MNPTAAGRPPGRDGVNLTAFPPGMTALDEKTNPGRLYSWAALGLLLLAALLHLGFLVAQCPFDLAGDEAHYWEWSRRLDWSYYSKGPLVAWIIAAGRWLLGDLSQAVVGTEMLAVRIPAILLSVLTGFGIYRMAQNASGHARDGLLAVLLSFTVPIFAAGSLLMTIDAPLLCAWTWMLVSIERALRRDSLRWWLAAGVLIAVGILAKYTMVLIAPVLVLTLLLSPGSRTMLRRPGVYLAALIGLLGFVPILAWNAAHEWVSFRHVAGQAGLSGRPTIHPLAPLEYVVGQALVVNPVWLLGILAAVRAACQTAPQAAAQQPGTPQPDALQPGSAARHLLAAAVIVPFGVFFVFSFVTKVQPNWPAQALPPGIALLAVWGAPRLVRPWPGRTRFRLAAGCGVLLGLSAVLVLHRTEVLAPLFRLLAQQAPAWDLTPVARYDPTSRLRGWSELAALGEVLAAERAAGRDPFILADDYQLASQIAFYAPGNPPVYCIQAALGDRLSQYDIWENPLRDADRFVGRPCVYVGRLHPLITGLDDAPAALPGLRKVRTIEHWVNGLRYQLWSVYACDSYAGFPQPAGISQRY